MLERIMAIAALLATAWVMFGLSLNALNIGASLGYGLLAVWAFISAIVLVTGQEDAL